MSVILAFDFGVKKMGIAVGNTETKTAQPLTILTMDNGTPNWQALFLLIQEWQAQILLVGLPLHIDGSESHLSKRASKFAKRLNHKLKENHTPKTVWLVDERLSSNEARSIQPKNKKNALVDDKAALVLLESWLHEPTGEKLL